MFPVTGWRRQVATWQGAVNVLVACNTVCVAVASASEAGDAAASSSNASPPGAEFAATASADIVVADTRGVEPGFPFGGRERGSLPVTAAVRMLTVNGVTCTSM